MPRTEGTVVVKDRTWWFDTGPRFGSSLMFRRRSRYPLIAGRAVVAVLLVGLVLVGASAPAGAVPKAGWSVVPSPNEGPAFDDNGLSGVSCASTKLCAAVGWFANETLVEAWDNRSWFVVSSPNKGSGFSEDELQSVSCASASSCAAVGDYLDSTGILRTLIESWDGTKWSVVSSPNETGSGGDELQGVSCTSASSCTAVGAYLSNRGVTRTLVESWDGTSWSVVPSPNVPISDEGGASSANFLDGISCASTHACKAVGHYYYLSNSGVLNTLVESWDGTKWSVVPSPNKGPASNYLQSVSCVAASVCTAVGDYRDNSVYKTLVESWDGTKWSVVPSPNKGPVSATNFLDGVSCVASRYCAAVGYYYPANNGVYKTLVESRYGTRWSVVASPNEAASGDNGLQSISCASAGRCIAVGWSENNRSVSRTLVETCRVRSALRASRRRALLA